MSERNVKPEPVPIPENVYRVIDAIRRSGVTNMLDRPMVTEIARQMGFQDEAQWIEQHPDIYANGVFLGFSPMPERRP